MNLVRTSAPAAMPVSLDEARAQLRQPPTDENALISGLIATATAFLEARNGIVGRALVTQSWRMRLHRFPGGRGVIELPFPPLLSVEAITYIDEAGDEVTVAPSDYAVDTGTYMGRVRPAYLKTWPVPRLDDWAVSIDFTCGYGAASDVPPPLKQAILMLVTHWYRNREAVSMIPAGSMGFAVEALISTYRVQEQ